MKSLFNFDVRFNWKTVTATIVTTLLLIVDSDHTFTSSVVLDRFILYLIVPLFVIIVVLRENPAEYGFRLGDWKTGLALTGIVIAIAAPILWFTAKGDASMQRNNFV